MVPQSYTVNDWSKHIHINKLLTFLLLSSGKNEALEV